MPLRIKQTLRQTNEAKKAIKRRISDEANTNLSDREFDSKIAQFLVNGKQATDPGLLAGSPIFSHSWSNFIKDEKLFIGTLNGKVNTLEEEIKNTAKENFGTLQNIQQEALAIDSFITEEEIKVLENYTTVHYNSFVRPVDQALGFNNTNWLIDYKTGFSFLPNNESNIVFNTGLTLPIKNQTKSAIKEVTLVGEDTDMGDSLKPILSTDPMNLLLDNKVFRHLIVRQDFDKTSRKFSFRETRLGLLLTLSNLQLVNYLVLQPLGQSTLQVSELNYVNEVGEEIELTNEVIQTEVGLVILFEPVRTKNIKLVLKQNSPITRTNVSIVDATTQQLNEVLSGVGYGQLLPENTENVMGKVYDFSLEKISVGLNTYSNLGVFRSKNVQVQAPIGLSINDSASRIEITSNQNTYGQNYSLPNGTVLNEYYVGVELFDKNRNTRLKDLIPVPDSYPIQREFLPLVGSVGRLKLFPDTRWNLDKVSVKSILPIVVGVNNTSLALVTLSSNHNYELGIYQEFTFVGPKGHAINGIFNGVPLTVDQILISANDSDASDLAVSANDRPITYVYLEALQEAPLTVYADDVELSLGSDYLISLDDGITYSDSWPRGQNYQAAIRLARSGRARIKIKNALNYKTYWIEYRVKADQFLGKTKLVELKNGRVVFDKRFVNTKGFFNTVIVSRADNINPFLTPVIQYYALKVLEDVS